MNAFVLKIIAVITMFIDHAGYVVFGKFSFFNYIGRLAFPIFAFQISEGYIHTKNLKKYFLRLLLFAIISQIPFMLFHSIISDSFALNVFFTLLLGLICIYIYDKLNYKSLALFVCALIGFIAEYTYCDYGFYGIAVILFFYIFKNNIINASIAFIILTAIKYGIPILNYGLIKEYIYLFVCTIIPVFFIVAYNGKKGKSTKYLLYLFYPIHLLLLYGIYLLK